MIHPFREVHWQPGPREQRRFALSLAVGVPCLAVVMFGLRRLVSGAWHVETLLWLGGIGLGLGALLLALPVLVKPFHVAWYSLACCASLVVSTLLIAAFYYLLVTPAGLLLRALGRMPLRTGADKRLKSYWEEGRRRPEVKRYFRQY